MRIKDSLRLLPGADGGDDRVTSCKEGFQDMGRNEAAAAWCIAQR